jgi:hypothetical protein
MREGPGVSLRSSGSTLQLAADAVELGWSPNLAALARVVDGADPKIELSQLPHLKAVPTGARYQRLWRGLYLRYAVMRSVIRFNGNIDAGTIATLPRRFFSQTMFVGGESPASVIFTSDDIRDLLVASRLSGKPGQDDRELTAYPLHPAGIGYVTSQALIVDSIAPWLQQTILELDLWSPVVSEPFEQAMLNVLRRHGFVAGGVDEGGHWDLPEALAHYPPEVQTIAESLARHGGSPGEIDALGWHEEFGQLVLLECKSINSIGNLQSVASTLSAADAQGWRSKLGKKAEWIASACGVDPVLSCVVLEGIEFMHATDPWAPQIFGREFFEAGIASKFGAGP